MWVFLIYTHCWYEKMELSLVFRNHTQDNEKLPFIDMAMHKVHYWKYLGRVNII